MGYFFCLMYYNHVFIFYFILSCFSFRYSTDFIVMEEIILKRWEKMNIPLHCLGFALTPRFYDPLYLKSPAPGGLSRRPPNMAPGGLSRRPSNWCESKWEKASWNHIVGDPWPSYILHLLLALQGGIFLAKWRPRKPP